MRRIIIKNTLYLCVSVAVFLFVSAAQAGIESHVFTDPQKEADYKHLVDELRCLVCQNQSLSDSNAELAHDLRQQVYDMLNQGKSREQIVEYMVARYGDFVLYNPPVKKITLLLWFGPLLFLLLAGVVIVVFIRNQKRAHVAVTTGQQQQAHKLLDD